MLFIPSDPDPGITFSVFSELRQFPLLNMLILTDFIFWRYRSSFFTCMLRSFTQFIFISYNISSQWFLILSGPALDGSPPLEAGLDLDSDMLLTSRIRQK